MFWQRDRPAPRAALEGNWITDVAVVGGGIAGLFAARRLLEAGVHVTLVEADIVGGQASGTSSGFLTADSELQVAQLERRFGTSTARALYEAASKVIDTISRDRIESERVDADCLYVSSDGEGTIREEHEARQRLGLESQLLDPPALREQLGGANRYRAGVRYGGTFAMNAFQYCQGLARKLEENSQDSLSPGGERAGVRGEGLHIFENTRVKALTRDGLDCEKGTIRCNQVILATDRFTPQLKIEQANVYRAQTVLALTNPLSRERLAALFPTGPLLLWNDAVNYRYLRPTADNRLLLGGNRLLSTYLSHSDDTASVAKMLVDDLRTELPGLGKLEIEHHWPGYIGTSRDLLPIAGRLDARHSVAICGVGLPWSALGGQVAASAVLGEEHPLARYFDPKRAFTELELLQPVLPKAITFSFSNLYAKEWLKGTSEQVARRKRVIAGAAIAAAAVGALAWLFSRSRRSERRVNRKKAPSRRSKSSPR